MNDDRGPAPGVATGLEPDADPFATEARPDALNSAIAALTEGWAAGRRPRAERFLVGLQGDDPDGLRELVYHEYCLAEAAGEAPDPIDYLARFPEIRDSLARLFGLHGAMAHMPRAWWDAPATAAMPEPGDEIGPYLLLRELGRGGMGRVFLAEQADLEDRLVVLKINTKPSPEAALLARVRHPHIVEVLRRAEVADGALYLIAMPFLGGASLAAVLTELAKRDGGGSGRDLLVALDRVGAPEFAPDVARSACRELLARLPRARAAAWIVARLAEALEHANRLGVTHGDLKPANVLIAADGRPMLLDFNLAVDWRAADAELGGVIGGTLAYMAPERLRALADPKSAPPTRPADRQRADLYALGLVLREILCDEPPDLPDGRFASIPMAAARLAEARERAHADWWSSARGVPKSLRPILARLLAPDPADRYSHMSELAEDLDLWGADRAPIHARERAGTSRTTRWASRHRRILLAGAAALALSFGVAWWTHGLMRARLRAQAEAKLATLWDSGDPAVFHARRFGRWSRDDVAELSRRNLDHYAAIDSDWWAREDVAALGPADRADLEMWLLEHSWRLANEWADRVEAPEDWSRALALLDSSPGWAALEAFDPLRRLLRERLDLPPATASQGRAAPWLSLYARGLAAESRSAREARGLYEAVLVEWPEALWPRYRAAVSAMKRNRPEAAIAHLSRCLERRPRNPALWTRRASCRLDAGDAEGAFADCDRALAIDPDYPDAYLVRCVARIRLNLLDGQEADAARLAQLTRSRGRSLSLGLSLFRAEAANLGPAPGASSEDADIQALVAKQLLAAGKEDEALELFDRVIAAAPDHLAARYDRACILLGQLRNEGLNEFALLVAHPRFDELVAFDPWTIQAIHHLAYHRLRTGAAGEARALAHRGLVLALELDLARLGEPGSALLAETRFGLARALVQESPGDPVAAREAADLLDAAGRDDPTWILEKFPRDRFFNPSRAAIVERLNALREARSGLGPATHDTPPRDASSR